MKKLLSIVLLLLICITAFAQNQHFKKGELNTQIGVGFISPLLLIGTDARFSIPPISATIEYGANDAVGIGGYLATARSSVFGQKYSYIDNEYNNPYVRLGDITHLIIGVRGTYHYELTPKLDTYLGAMIGYNKMIINTSQVQSEVGLQAQGITYTVMLGGKLPMNERLGAFFELGYGVSIINMGLTFKL